MIRPTVGSKAQHAISVVGTEAVLGKGGRVPSAEDVERHMADSKNDASVPLKLVAGRKTTGEPVYEEVLGSPRPGGTFEVLKTPGLVMGIAAGDQIQIGDEPGTFDVVERGGNLAIHVYGPGSAGRSIESDVGRLGGWWDGGIPDRLTIYTIPVTAGWAAIEDLLNRLARSAGDVEWFYGNVYAEDGSTPLNWW